MRDSVIYWGGDHENGINDYSAAIGADSMYSF